MKYCFQLIFTGMLNVRSDLDTIGNGAKNSGKPEF